MLTYYEREDTESPGAGYKPGRPCSAGVPVDEATDSGRTHGYRPVDIHSLGRRTARLAGRTAADRSARGGSVLQAGLSSAAVRTGAFGWPGTDAYGMDHRAGSAAARAALPGRSADAAPEAGHRAAKGGVAGRGADVAEPGAAGGVVRAGSVCGAP